MIKKSFYIILLVFILFSCNKDGKDSDVTEDVGSDSSLTSEVLESELLTDAVNTYQGLSFFNKPGKEYLGKLSSGEVLSTTGLIEQNEKGTEFIEVIRSNGDRGWAMKHYIVENAKPGVIILTEELTIFDENNDNSISRIDIEPFRILAVDNSLIDDSFSRVSWNRVDSYDVYRNKYVLKDEISFKKDDIEFAKILTSYLAEDRDNVKKELLENAKAYITISPAFRNYLNRLEMDDSLPMVPSVNSVELEYESDVTIDSNSSRLELLEESKNLEPLENFKFDLLKYLLLNIEYSQTTLLINIYNTSNFNFTTLPSELVIESGNKKYYLGVVSALTIPSKEKVSIRLKGRIPSDKLEDLKPGFRIGFDFVNGINIKSHEVILEKGGEE